MFKSRLNISEIDGSPSVWPYKLLVSNGTLTDNGDGTATLSGGSSTGTIAQTVQTTTLNNDNTTSATFTATTITATITPTAATSKIKVSCTFTFSTADNNAYGIATLFRGATNLAGGTDGMATVFGPNDVNGINTNCCIVYLDSPATTSATVYKLYIRNNGAGTTVQTGNNSRIQSIMLLEELTQ